MMVLHSFPCLVVYMLIYVALFSSRRAAAVQVMALAALDLVCYTAESVLSWLVERKVQTKEMEVVVTSNRPNLGCLPVV